MKASTAALILTAVLCAGCAALGRPSPASSGPTPPAQAQAYDRGMKLFAAENYEEARKAWEEAVRLGPRTAIGRKARENLLRTERILKTLREIGSP